MRAKSVVHEDLRDLIVRWARILLDFQARHFTRGGYVEFWCDAVGDGAAAQVSVARRGGSEAQGRRPALEENPAPVRPARDESAAGGRVSPSAPKRSHPTTVHSKRKIVRESSFL